MSLVKIKPFITDNVSNFTFGGLTITANAAFGNADLGNLASANFVSVTSNITSGNANLGNAASANYFIGNGSLLTGITTTSLVNGTSNVVVSNNGNASVSIGGTGNVIVITTTGANVNGYVSATSFVGEAGNLSNIQGANVSGAVASATVAATVTTAAQPNITSLGLLANLSVNGNSSFIGNANIVGNINQSGGTSNLSNVTASGNVAFSGANVSLGSVSNLHISGGSANYVLQTDGEGNLAWAAQAAGSGSSGGESTVTSVDTFTGDGTETVFTLSVAPQSINQTLINYNGALQLRNAYTLSGQDITFSEAPADGSTIEVTTQMGVTSGSGNLTVRNYTADGVQTTYAVSAGVNATNILVTENGLVQMPVVDYTVSGSTLTFTSAPGYDVKIQIRELGIAVATITPAGSNTQVLFNDAGSFGHSAAFTFNNTSNTLSVNNINVTGNIVPTANVTYNLGNSTNRFKDLFLSGNTIDLGGAQIKTDSTSGAIAFVPPATVAEPNPTALVISSTGGISTAITSNGVLSSNAITVAAATGTLSSPRYITMHTTGNISASTGTSRYYPPGNVNINNVSASLSTAPTANMTFQICKNGSNVAAFTISANSYILAKTSANIVLSTSDYLTVNIVSGDGNDLRMDLQYVAA